MGTIRSVIRQQRSTAFCIILGFTVLCIFLTDCADQDSTVSNPDISGAIQYTVWPGSCKEFVPFPEPDVVPPHKDCMEYAYQPDSTLELHHTNAGFNCCPGAIEISITVEDTAITIEEVESRTACSCACLFDLVYEIDHLRPGSYVIRVSEQSVQEGSDPLEFSVDLRNQTSGTYCVDRVQDPWYKMFPDPSGSLVGASDCKTFESFLGDSAIPSNMDCIAYTYNSDFTLDLKHINAGFNCCPGQFRTTITADDTLIIVETVESVHGCRCTCLFDLDYEIEHVAPGVHRIKIIEQCLGEDDELIDFMVDLSMPISDIYCVERTHTPWDWPIF